MLSTKASFPIIFLFDPLHPCSADCSPPATPATPLCADVQQHHPTQRILLPVPHTSGRVWVSCCNPTATAVPTQSPGKEYTANGPWAQGITGNCIPGLILSNQQFKAKIHQAPLLLPHLVRQKPVCKGLTFRQPALTTVNLLLSSFSFFF